METIATIEGKKIGLKASAGTIRRYREQFGRDMIQDMDLLETHFLKEKVFTTEESEIAENAIWLMAKEYNSSIPEIHEWLEQWSPYFIYQAIVQVIVMWTKNLQTLNTQKKK